MLMLTILMALFAISLPSHRYIMRVSVVGKKQCNTSQQGVYFPWMGWKLLPDKTDIMTLLTLLVYITCLYRIFRLTCKWEYFHGCCACKPLMFPATICTNMGAANRAVHGTSTFVVALRNIVIWILLRLSM